MLTVVTETVTDVNRHTYTACVILEGFLISIWTSRQIFGKYPTQNLSKTVRGESNVPCGRKDGKHEANSRLSELACKRA